MSPSEQQALSMLGQVGSSSELIHVIATMLMAALAAGMAWLAAPAHQAMLEHSIMAWPKTPTWLKAYIPSTLSAAVAWGLIHIGVPPMAAGAGALGLAGFTHLHNESDQAASSEDSAAAKATGSDAGAKQ